MPEYRLYLLDRHSGHIDGVETLWSADDVGAICLVQERSDSVPVELWCGGRKVRRFEARPDVARPDAAPQAMKPGGSLTWISALGGEAD